MTLRAHTIMHTTASPPPVPSATVERLFFTIKNEEARCHVGQPRRIFKAKTYELHGVLVPTELRVFERDTWVVSKGISHIYIWSYHSDLAYGPRGRIPRWWHNSLQLSSIFVELCQRAVISDRSNRRPFKLSSDYETTYKTVGLKTWKLDQLWCISEKCHDNVDGTSWQMFLKLRHKMDLLDTYLGN